MVYSGYGFYRNELGVRVPGSAFCVRVLCPNRVDLFVTDFLMK